MRSKSEPKFFPGTVPENDGLERARVVADQESGVRLRKSLSNRLNSSV